MEEENEKPCLKDKILELGCFGYKGGELSTPYMYDSIEDFIVSSVRVWDKLYIKNRDHGNETGEKWVAAATKEEIIEVVDEAMDDIFDNIYAGGEEHVTALYKVNTTSYLLDEITYDRDTINWNEVVEYLRING